MSGAWEIQNNASVLCAILHTETTSMAWAFGLRNLIIPGHVIGLTGMPYDMARNQSAVKTLEGGFTHLFCYDSDVVAPKDTILRLLAHKLPIVSGLYCRRSPPHAVPVMIKNGTWVTNYAPGSMVDVDFVGAGCLLIERSVLERFPPQEPGKHWFNWTVDKQGVLPPGQCLSEDFTFCRICREVMGLKVMVDTSIVCRHVGFAQALPGAFVPCDTTPIT